MWPPTQQRQRRAGIVFCLTVGAWTIVLGGVPCAAQENGPAIQHSADLSDLPAELLIDQLTEVSKQGIGFHATAWADAFIAISDEAEFGDGILGSVKPAVSPTMREIVRRGADILPDLIRHLGDNRKSRLRVPGGAFPVLWLSREYDPRYADAARQPAGVFTHGEDMPHPKFLDEYTVTVGDLCYVAIGQIVNRRLNVLRYEPSGCVVINSPVRMPALATAVEQDWGDVGVAEHRESLLRDALGGTARRSDGALVRLAFYYPTAIREYWLRQILRLVLLLLVAGAGTAVIWRLRRRRRKPSASGT
jgi:hypothetical protein